ncbi:hypothetical protein BSKO_07185 [Bryopsis sp. KO-2023]|nr:hypothetical protein BSKO_07185 [Bryopsis sp. KO-2023]
MSGGGAVRFFTGDRALNRSPTLANARTAFRCPKKRPSESPHWRKPVQFSRVYCVARSKEGSKSENERLDAAAEDYLVGLEAGLNPDDIISRQLGIKSSQELTDTQKEYLSTVKQKISKRAKAIKKEREAAENVNFKIGKYAYSKGDYSGAVEALEKTVEECGTLSAVGGEASLWLALAYQAVGREKECIELYKELKERHVNRMIRKKATDLLYIMEAPKLKLTQEERVKVPVMENAERWSPRGSFGARPSSSGIKTKKQVKKSLEDQFWDEYQPPKLVRNRYVWIASFILAVGLAWYSTGMSR